MLYFLPLLTFITMFLFTYFGAPRGYNHRYTRMNRIEFSLFIGFIFGGFVWGIMYNYFK